MPGEVFQSRRDSYRETEARCRLRYDRFSNLRLLLFALGAGGTFAAGHFISPGGAMAVAAVFIAAFLSVLTRHDRIAREMEHAGRMAAINQHYIDRLEDDWHSCSDDGAEFADHHHPYSNDLDIFGPASVFQWLSTARTYTGRNKLEELLSGRKNSLAAIGQRQAAVRELAAKLGFCQEIECAASSAPEIQLNPVFILSYAETRVSLFLNPAFRLVAFGLPVVMIISLALMAIGQISAQAPLVLASVQIILGWGMRRQVSRCLGRVDSFKEKVAAFRSLFLLIESEELEADLLAELRAALKVQGHTASEAMKSLESISAAVDLRHQPLVHFPANAILMWDVLCAIRLEQWKNRYGAAVRGWLESAGTMEALASLAVPGFLHPDWAWPEISGEKPMIEARDLGHPLLNPARCVGNDISLQGRYGIVTGSNMSGKSTWLRAIGVNLALAYAGAPVCAREFRCSLMSVNTSMVIRDDLAGGISTFYAELLRIAMIVEQARRGEPMIYLIDEIFRGTNSLDRIAGARAVLKELVRPHTIGLISTHDFELCDFEQEFPGQFVNCHFEEQYIDGKIHFDYRLRQGRCTTANARFLMQMVGLTVD